MYRTGNLCGSYCDVYCSLRNSWLDILTVKFGTVGDVKEGDVSTGSSASLAMADVLQVLPMR